MTRYKVVDMSPRFLPVVLDDQLVPGTFAHAVHHLADGLDLADFDAHYRNDANGAPAHSPAMLLKAVLLGYSQAIVSSRSIEAVTTSAHKLARLAYTMITKGEQYVDQGQAYFEQQHRDRAIRNLMHSAQRLGMTLVDMPAGTATTA